MYCIMYFCLILMLNISNLHSTRQLILAVLSFYASHEGEEVLIKHGCLIELLSDSVFLINAT